jgi:hypothetical protein
MMSSVCDWAHLDLCQKPQGPASLIKCIEDGCNCVLHHMCQCMWESDDEDVCQAHGTRKFCAYHHPALAKGQYYAETGPPSNLLQGLSQSTMEEVSTMTIATSLPLLGNINITGQSLPANGQEDFYNPQEMTMMLKNFLPFNIFGIAHILKKIPPLDGSVFGAVMCLSLSMLHVPSIM